MSTKVNTKILDLLCILPIAVLLLIFYKSGIDMYFTIESWTEFLQNEIIRNTFYVSTDYINYIRPVKYGFVDLLHSLFGLNPVPYHVVILCLHFINSILVFIVVRRVFADRLVGLLAACLFASFWTHPEAVAWLPGMHDVMVTFFSLSCLIFFYKYRMNPIWYNYILSLLALVLAFGTKEFAAVYLPPLLYLTDRYIALESKDTRLGKAVYVPFFLLSAGWVILMMSMMSTRDADDVTKWSASVENLVRSITFSFAFPLFSESPRFGIINLILLTFFYFYSSDEIKGRLSLLMAALVAVSLPTAPAGSPALRYLYFGCVFSMTLMAVMLYCGALQLSKRVKVTEGLCRALVTFYILLLVYSNYLLVNAQLEAFNRVGNLTKNLLQTVTPPFTKDTHLVFINMPHQLKPHFRYSAGGMEPIWGYYGRDMVAAKVTMVNLLEVWDSESGYTLPDLKPITSKEFEELTLGKDHKVYLFDPKNDSFHNVTGKDYAFLRKVLSDN